MRFKKQLNRGQIAVILALILPVLLGSMALGTDIAILYFNWVQMQKAADAAVLAGANYLPGDPSQAQTVANNNAMTNGIAQSEIVSTIVASDDMSITMTVNRNVNYYFAKALGLTTGGVGTAATAGIQSNTPTSRGLMPVGLPCSTGNCDYTVGQQYVLKAPKTTGSWGQLGPGNWAPLALGGNGAAVYRQNLELGYVGQLNIGQDVSTETGQITGPTQQGLAGRISLGQTIYPSANPASPSPYDPRLVVVPMVDFSGSNGESSVPIVNFALMFIDAVTGNNASIDAYYLGTLPSSDTSSTSQQNFGLLTPILLK
ncbi:MAG: hypothetical protein IVW54_10240 [Candidatus Binataceae bacterium]|nr:hypothetical protein [Candidatus Binataceae bacterium]